MNYNLKNPAVKRILQEIKEVQADTSGDFIAEALENDIFEWHFVIRGPVDSEFEGGVYHGRILLPADYPFKPPAFMMLTPSGRFETGVKICLSISAHHPEHWQPSWSVRTALTALVAFMPSPGAGALASLDYTKDERKKLAAKSRQEAPKWGSAERQRLIEEMHARMLAMPPAQTSAAKPSTSEAPAAAAPHTAPAAATEQQSNPAEAGTDAGPTSAVSSAVPAPTDTSPAQSPKQASTPAPTPKHPSRTPGANPSGPAMQPPPATSSDATPAAVPAPPHSHAPSCVKHRESGPSSAPATPTVSRHSPAVTPRSPLAPAPAPTTDLPPPDTWALNAIAVALGVLILAILLRKALVAVGYEVPSITGLGAFTDGR